ncbi:hypothetical protein [Methyloprofundus sp.]|uniref:hypothetical protein n=1 Tax=Methyloprofundus sp. TaxID=2020875 RepID=UPI003D12FB84
MLIKGYMGAIQDIWLSYGNTASSLGNVPGSLSAYIIGAPLKIWLSPWAPMGFLIFLHIGSFLLFDSVIKKIFDPQIRLVFMVIYWLNPWFLFENTLWNPSYLSFFTALHFWTAFQMQHKKSFLYSFLHLLAIGMAMQLHYSWPILAVISSFLFYRGIIKIHWLGLITSAVVILISLIPYLQESLINQGIPKNEGNESDGRYIGWGGVHVYPVLKAFYYWLRYASFLFTNKIVLGASFNALSANTLVQTVTLYSWRGLLFAMGGLSLLFTLKANYAAWIKIKPFITRKNAAAELSHEKWLLLYVVGTLFAVLLSSALSPIIFSFWHLLIVFPIALFPVLSFVNDWAKNNEKKLPKYLLLIFCYFMLVNLVAANDSKKYSYSLSYSQQAMAYIQEQNLQEPD